jgi:aspartate kinase
MKILKFGGTSVGTPERMHALVPLISIPGKRIIVLSAVAGTTNTLVEISSLLYTNKNDEAIAKLNKLEKFYAEFVDHLFSTPLFKTSGHELIQNHFDYLRSFATDTFNIYEERAILAQGELISTALFHFYLQESGLSSILLAALNFMHTDENGEPEIELIHQQLEWELNQFPEQNLFVTQGYICRNSFGEIDNLRRGGSDYSASIIASAIGATEIQIWTDIDGMHNMDPRIITGTHPIAELSYDEAAELAYFGAKILHPSSISPARSKKIPVRLLNTMDPSARGTLVTETSKGDKIKAVAAKDGITAIKIRSGRMLMAYGFLRSVFEVFERFRTPIDMITTSEVAVSITIDNTDHLNDIILDLENFGHVETDYDQSIVCIVGDFLQEKEGYALTIFESLKQIPIRMISYGGSKNNISLLIHTKDKQRALSALNEGLFINPKSLA